MRIDGPVWALGAMSGTSLDGVDAAMVRTDGARILEFGETGYRPYTEGERAMLRGALGRWPGDSGVAEAAKTVEAAHAELLAGFGDADLVGFHGQTLAHDPQGRRTHQAGDGTRLAAALGLPVVWDFRSADVARGGEGAPLAPFYHHACARFVGADGPTGFLNLGGGGNLSWVDPRSPAPEAPGACLAFDTGPANAPVDDLVRARAGLPCDRDGALAAAGEVDRDALKRALALPYFGRKPPKSLDRDDFAEVSGWALGLSTEDAAATLTAFAAAAVVAGLAHCPSPPERILVGGGGRRNPTLMAALAGDAGCPVEPVEAEGLDGDMLEAQAFAFLAVRAARGWPTSAPSTTGVAAAVSGGRVSSPSVD